MPGRRPTAWPAFYFSILFLPCSSLFQMTKYFSSRQAIREVIGSLLRGQVHTLGVGMHNFMDAAQVARADVDPVIRARLDSCVFKGAVKRDGEWVEVPMCSMNQETWAKVYDERLNDPELIKQPQVASSGS